MTGKPGLQRTVTICLVMGIMLANLSIPVLVAAAEPNITITGRLLVHHKGDPIGNLVPIPNARVEIYDEEIIEYPVAGWAHLPWLDTYLGAIYTDNNGYFSFTTNNNDGWTVIGDEKGRDIYLKFMASNRASEVKNNPGWLAGSIYSFKTNTNRNLADSATWNIGNIAPDDANCEIAFETMHIVELAWLHVKETTGAELSKLNVFTDDFFTTDNSYYLTDPVEDYLIDFLPQLNPEYYPTELITFLTSLTPEGVSPVEKGLIRDVAGIHLFNMSGRGTEDYYRVIFHEYGHHLMFELFDVGPPFSQAGDHNLSSEFTPEHAWVEGWAEFYSVIAANRYGIGSTQSYFDIEDDFGLFDYSEEHNWDSIEGNIASILWDITDENNEDQDDLSLSFAELATLIRVYDPEPDWNKYWPKAKDHVWNIHDIFSAFRSRYDPETIGKLWVILNAHGITEPDTTAPNNPTSYLSSHSPVIGSSNTNIQVDLLGANDDISGVKEYFYFWEYRPEVINNLVGKDWSSERWNIEHYWENSESPHIELEIAVTGDWYLFVTNFDNAGNWAGEVFRAGPFLVRENPTLLLEGLIISSPTSNFVTPDTTLTVETPTRPGKTFTDTITLRLPDIIDSELDYTSPIALGSILGYDSGLYELEVKFFEETGADETQLVQLTLDNYAPVLNIQISEPAYSSGPTFISRYTAFIITATDAGVGVKKVEYRISNCDFDSGWIQYFNPVYLTSLPDGEYTFMARAKDRLNNQESDQISIFIDNSSPETEILIGSPKYSNLPTVITESTLFSIEGSDTGAGLSSKKYRISDQNSEGEWTSYIEPFTLSGKSDGNYIVEQSCEDELGNTKQSSISISIDNTAPVINWLSVAENSALQGNVNLNLQADDAHGVISCKFSIVQTDPPKETALPPDLSPATYDPTTQLWILPIDTQQFEDGHYRLTIETRDCLGNQATNSFEYTIRNWAVLNLCHNTENSKAGRTIPIKFDLHIAGTVDETEPSVYNEELEIKVFKTEEPSTILQVFTFGTALNDYRIATDTNQYICNFKTLKTPADYTASITFNGIEIGAITFSTVK